MSHVHVDLLPLILGIPQAISVGNWAKRWQDEHTFQDLLLLPKPSIDYPVPWWRYNLYPSIMISESLIVASKCVSDRPITFIPLFVLKIILSSSIFGNRERIFWWHNFSPFCFSKSVNPSSFGMKVSLLSEPSIDSGVDINAQFLQHFVTSKSGPMHFRWKWPQHASHTTCPWFFRIFFEHKEHVKQCGPGLRKMSFACIRTPAAKTKFVNLITLITRFVATGVVIVPLSFLLSFLLITGRSFRQLSSALAFDSQLTTSTEDRFRSIFRAKCSVFPILPLRNKKLEPVFNFWTVRFAKSCWKTRINMTQCSTRPRVSAMLKAKSAVWENRLSIHPIKTEAVLFGTHQRIAVNNELNLVLGNACVKRVQHYKYLGIILDANLNFHEHVDRLHCKLSSRLGALRRRRKHLTVDAANKVYTATILPLLDYCDIAWSSIGKTACARLDKLQERASKLILPQSREPLKHLKWLPLAKRRDMHTTTMTFRCMSGKVPVSFKQYFKRNSCPYELRKNKNNLMIPRVNTEIASGSFYYSGAKLYNNLPNKIKTSLSMSALKKFYFK